MSFLVQVTMGKKISLFFAKSRTAMYWLVFSLLLFALPAFAQADQDSPQSQGATEKQRSTKIQRLNELAFELKYDRSDTVFILLHQAVTLAEGIGDTLGAVTALNILGDAFQNRLQMDSASFIGVPANRSVKLQFFEPIDHRFSLKDKGSNDNIDSDASRSNGMTGTFQASQGSQVHTKMDCGLWSPGEVAAFVWNDLDGDGKQDAGEPGIEGVFVELLESNNDLLVSTTTDPNGLVTIFDVPADRAVKLAFTAPAGYSITLKDRGSNDNIDSDASLSSGRTATFQATMGQQLFAKWDAGLVEEGTNGARIVQEQLEAPTSPLTVGQDITRQTSGLNLEAFPNPFSDRLTIRYALGESGPVNLAVFNLQGQLVRQLYQGQTDLGEQQIQAWDGTDANGNLLPAGMYLIQMKTREEVVNRKVLLQH